MGRLLKRSLYSDPDHRNRVVAKRTIGKTVLDVGGYSDCADYFANKTYVCVNKPIPLHKHRRFDSKILPGMQLGFEDRSFDTVVSIDALEHVQSKDRRKLVLEMLRTARKRTILLFPFFKPKSVSFEPSFSDVCKKLGLAVKPSIAEHLQYGLPEESEVASWIPASYSVKKAYFTRRNIFDAFMIGQCFLAAICQSEKEWKPIQKDLQSAFENALSQAPLARSAAYRCMLVIDPKKK